VLDIFEIGSCFCYSGWLQTTILLISTSQVARITGMSHQCQWRWSYWAVCVKIFVDKETGMWPPDGKRNKRQILWLVLRLYTEEIILVDSYVVCVTGAISSTLVYSFSLYKIPMTQILLLLFPSYRLRNWGTKKFSTLGSRWAGSRVQALTKQHISAYTSMVSPCSGRTTQYHKKGSDHIPLAQDKCGFCWVGIGSHHWEAEKL
jgi:hypothetical protein